MTFEYYPRTGCRRVAQPTTVEIKFNPWHDPEDGRFTFAGRGRYFAAGDRSSGGSTGPRTGAARANEQAGPRAWWTDPSNPRNHSIYTVRRGDSLTKIARVRKGLTANDLAWLNGLHATDKLRVGQVLKVPHQRYLDDGKRARNNFLALAHYADITGGKLPPNPARSPSIADQVEASGVREIHRNGYAYDVDTLGRTRHVSGEIRLQSEQRSRKTQAGAGNPDRRKTDDGGHYIAVRFNGPREWFNHFAQDSNFNRGGYRVLEDKWAAIIRSGERVFVDIVPHYRGTSKRPYRLTVSWVVDGREDSVDFQNERGGR